MTNTTLVVGASGATGRLLVEQLLERGEHVRAIVRKAESLSALSAKYATLSVVEASLLELGDAQLVQHVGGCRAIASCLGHNLSLRGVFGSPRRLVTDATRRLCEVLKTVLPAQPVKFVLMNTTGNRNRDLDERISLAQRCVIGLLRVLVPPHADNEEAAEYLRTSLGQHDRAIEWVAVRPDGLIDEDQVGEYDVHASPTRSAIFDAGSTGRIQVAHFMARLITEADTWKRWQGQMPVIYDQA